MFHRWFQIKTFGSLSEASPFINHLLSVLCRVNFLAHVLRHTNMSLRNEVLREQEDLSDQLNQKQ